MPPLLMDSSTSRRLGTATDELSDFEAISIVFLPSTMLATLSVEVNLIAILALIHCMSGSEP